MARPSRINATITRTDGTESTVGATVIDAVGAGATREKVAEAAGIARSTLQAWLQRGREADPETNDISERTYLDFSDSLKRVEATFENDVVTRILEHGETSWQALAWILERRYPTRYGRATRVGPVAEPDDDAPVTDEIAERFLAYVRGQAAS